MRRLLLALMASLTAVCFTSSGVLGNGAAGGWTVFDWNPGNSIAPRHSAGSMPATTTGATTSFDFIPGTFTALLVTSDSSLTGDLSGKTLTDTITWSGTGSFSEQNGGGCAPDNQYVRFYFESPSAAGPSTGTPPRGFYTQFWWSNPVHVNLTDNAGTFIIAVPVAGIGQWSDWNGQENSNPAVADGFQEAIHEVQTVGLSFGGGCFFENGVTTTAGGTFTSTFGEA